MFNHTKEEELKDKVCSDCGHKWRARVINPKQCPRCTHALHRQKPNQEPKEPAPIIGVDKKIKLSSGDEWF